MMTLYFEPPLVFLEALPATSCDVGDGAGDETRSSQVKLGLMSRLVRQSHVHRPVRAVVDTLLLFEADEGGLHHLQGERGQVVGGLQQPRAVK